MTERIIGPGGNCPHCYHHPCECSLTNEQIQLAHKRQKAHGTLVEMLTCEACGQDGVVPDAVQRAFVCLRCGKQQTPYEPGALA